MHNADTPDARTNATDDLDLDTIVTAVIQPVAHRLGLRRFLKGQHLHAVMLDMVALDAQGANEAELLAYGLALTDLAHTLASQRRMSDKDAERQHLEADLREDHTRGVMAIDGESASVLDQHADALVKEGAAAFVLAHVQRRKARRIRTGRAIARQQVGLGGVA